MQNSCMSVALPTVSIHQRQHGVMTREQVAAYLQQELSLSEAPVFVRSNKGRPQVQLESFDCNWSHSGELLAMAWSSQHRVGIDIEQVRPRPQWQRVAERFLLPAEYAQLTDANDFLQLWVRKEALLKAIGQGLAHGLRFVEFAKAHGEWQLQAVSPALDVPSDWNVCGLDIDEGYIGALAWRDRYTVAHDD